MSTINPLIIVITYNPDEQFFERLLDKQYPYLVVDNSEEPQDKFIAELNKRNIPSIINNQNRGIATALNQGCQYAMDNGYEWAITMDQDSELTTEIIEGITNFAEHYEHPDKLAVVSPRHVIQSGKIAGLPSALKNDISEDIFGMTSGNLVNLNIWKDLGQFRDDFFIDLVDIEYYCRALLNNYRVLTLNKLHMQHNLGNATFFSHFGIRFNILHHNYIRKYYQIRNTLTVRKLYKKHKQLNTKRLTYMMIYKNIICVVFFEQDKLRKLWYMLKGWIDYIRLR